MQWSFEVRDPRWIAAVFLVFGAVFLTVGGLWAQRTYDFRRTAIVTEGVVIELSKTRSGAYAPVFQYVDLNGERHTITSATASSPPAFDVGENVRVLYLPGVTNDARLDTVIELWLGPGVFAALALAFLAFGAAIARFTRGDSGAPRTNTTYRPYRSW